jgi:hypothetical protein
MTYIDSALVCPTRHGMDDWLRCQGEIISSGEKFTTRESERNRLGRDGDMNADC